MDGSLPGSPVPGILQARTLEWVAISFSNAWKWKVKVKSLSRVRPSATPRTAAYQAPPSMGFSRQEYWSGVPLPSPPSCLPIILSIYQLLWAVFSWRSGLTLSRARISRSGHPKSDLGMRILVLTLERTLNTFQVALVVKNSLATAGDMRWGFDPQVRKIPWRRTWQTTPVFLPGGSHGQRTIQATVHRIAKSWTWLKQFTMFACISPWHLLFCLLSLWIYLFWIFLIN